MCNFSGRYDTSFVVTSSDAEHRRRSTASWWVGADVHVLLQLVHRALLSPGQSLPPRLCQTAADGAWYDFARLLPLAWAKMKSIFLYKFIKPTVSGLCALVYVSDNGDIGAVHHHLFSVVLLLPPCSQHHGERRAHLRPPASMARSVRHHGINEWEWKQSPYS